MTGIYYLTIEGEIPPSFNRVGGTSHWRQWQSHKKLWEHRMVQMLREQGVPRGTEQFARTTAILTVPTRRRRDAGNFGALLEKSLGDALQVAQIIPDDTPEWWSWTSVTFQHVPKVKATTIVVELVDEMGRVAA